MFTENLEEMIQPTPYEPCKYADYDPNDTMAYKKDDLANSKPESMATEISASEPALSPIKKPDISDSNYQPDTEQALIDYTRQMHNKIEIASIITYWKIGRSISMFYKGENGTRELEKIAEATGIGRDNLNKMIKFAGQYSVEQLEALIKGRFAIPWNGIAQNLAIKPEQLIDVYEKASNVGEFHNGIMKCKNQDEKRGKSKLPEVKAITVEISDQSKVAPTMSTVAVIPEIVETKTVVAGGSIIVALEIMPEESMSAEYHEPADAIDPDELAQQYEVYAEELETLRLENECLKKEISDKDQQIDSMNAILAENERDIKDKDLIMATYRDRLKRVRYMIDNNFGVGQIMELLVAVV